MSEPLKTCPLCEHDLDEEYCPNCHVTVPNKDYVMRTGESNLDIALDFVRMFLDSVDEGRKRGDCIEDEEWAAYIRGRLLLARVEDEAAATTPQTGGPVRPMPLEVSAFSVTVRFSMGGMETVEMKFPQERPGEIGGPLVTIKDGSRVVELGSCRGEMRVMLRAADIILNQLLRTGFPKPKGVE